MEAEPSVDLRSVLSTAGFGDLPADWGVVTLGSLLSEDRGISVGVMYPGSHDPLGVPLIKAGDLSNNRINPRPDYRIAPSVHHDYRRTELSGGEILMTLVGNVGSCAVVPERMRGWNAARAVAVMRFREPSDASYIRACLQTRQLQHLMSVWSNTTVQQTLNLREVKLLPVPWPDRPTRSAIARVLGTIEDKIEVNRQMNETLEAMARALFKSWFVDFDPVHAKAAGRAPIGMDAEAAQLFPSEFVDSDLGPIPKGWRTQPLGELVSALSGGTPSKGNKELWGGDIPWISPKSMTAIHADEAEDFVADGAVGKGTRLAPSGSTLVMVRGMGLHQCVRVSQARRDVTFNQDVKALIGRTIDPTLLLFALLNSQGELLGRVESSGHGTGKLPSEILLGQRITMPPSEEQTRLARLFESLNDRIAASRQESRTLASIRDELLPRMLSGALSLPGAQTQVEAVT